METEEIKAIEKQLDDVEFYSPTMPLRWQEYHSIIRKLLKEAKNVQHPDRPVAER
jgi:hypothetical protein